jgi:hypothetical protein
VRELGLLVEAGKELVHERLAPEKVRRNGLEKGTHTLVRFGDWRRSLGTLAKSTKHGKSLPVRSLGPNQVKKRI